MDWLTAPDHIAPAGWEVSGFYQGLLNTPLCKNGWYAFADDGNSATQGTLSAKMKGYGIVTVQYRDCYKGGSATVYLNGEQKGQSGDRNGELETTT